MSAPFVEGDELRQTALEDRLAARAWFEVRSWLGRAFFSRPPPDASEPRLLNLGCGGVLLDGWVNADFFYVRPWRAPASYWAVDLRHPLRCPSDHFDGVFCEHTIEHLSPAQAGRLLAEVFRILKPGAWLRINFPDLAKYARAYVGEPPDEAFRRFEPRGAGIRSLTQGWGHRSVWDEELMAAALVGIGFEEVRSVAFQQGSDARLFVDSPDRAWETAYVEGRKPRLERSESP